MASQQTKQPDVIEKRGIEVEKDRVPKMATHFESLAVKDTPPHPHEATIPVKVVGIEHTGHRAVESPKKTHETEHKKSPESQTEHNERPTLEDISKVRGAAQQNSMEAINAAQQRYQQAKEASVQGIQSGTQYVSEKGGALKDTAMEKVQPAAQYAAEKARSAKDTTIDTTTTAASYVQEKAGAAKDVTLESGRGAAGYAGKVASTVTDQASVAGWGAAHYTMEKVAEATKAVAGVTSSVAGYTGEKAGQAKDVVTGFTTDKIAAAKDMVVSAEEKAAEYAARKHEEAKRGVEAKKSSPSPHEKVEGMQGTFIREGKGDAPSEKVEGYFEEGGKEQHSGGGVFKAIGETIVEIGKTTTDILSGNSPISGGGKKRSEGKDVDPAYGEGGEGI